MKKRDLKKRLASLMDDYSWCLEENECLDETVISLMFELDTANRRLEILEKGLFVKSEAFKNPLDPRQNYTIIYYEESDRNAT